MNSADKAKQKIINMVPYLTYDQFFTYIAPTAILIVISLMFLCMVFPKKKQLKDKAKNESYCVISDYILTFTILNMIIFSFCVGAVILLDYNVTSSCNSMTDSSDECYKAKEIWS
jgi:NADH:ubiquinone oxidoreductase subunit 6 (subunit J)